MDYQTKTLHNGRMVRRIAANIAKLPELVRRQRRCALAPASADPHERTKNVSVPQRIDLPPFSAFAAGVHSGSPQENGHFSTSPVAHQCFQFLCYHYCSRNRTIGIPDWHGSDTKPELLPFVGGTDELSANRRGVRTPIGTLTH